MALSCEGKLADRLKAASQAEEGAVVIHIQDIMREAEGSCT